MKLFSLLTLSSLFFTALFANEDINMKLSLKKLKAPTAFLVTGNARNFDSKDENIAYLNSSLNEYIIQFSTLNRKFSQLKSDYGKCTNSHFKFKELKETYTKNISELTTKNSSLLSKFDEFKNILQKQKLISATELDKQLDLLTNLNANNIYLNNEIHLLKLKNRKLFSKDRKSKKLSIDKLEKLKSFEVISINNSKLLKSIENLKNELSEVTNAAKEKIAETNSSILNLKKENSYLSDSVTSKLNNINSLKNSLSLRDEEINVLSNLNSKNIQKEIDNKNKIKYSKSIYSNFNFFHILIILSSFLLIFIARKIND